ncbi:hypothetical protein HYH03_012164 [Edaphochlamys debaryana]|uniref:Uncharacterized protein n=1 Tax=Edaphochlamys debaryana TaxID=47281 RepID=A0A835Y1D8_9CHLO|nr:hypothetical protein HYH03_012164 [Edaphochlamys debaryana]|eukprot:KAG2489334.1 hypothetical protein HYH03_012164 [Edaphochlamys debaryana]
MADEEGDWSGLDGGAAPLDAEAGGDNQDESARYADAHEAANEFEEPEPAVNAEPDLGLAEAGGDGDGNDDAGMGNEEGAGAAGEEEPDQEEGDPAGVEGSDGEGAADGEAEPEAADNQDANEEAATGSEAGADDDEAGEDAGQGGDEYAGGDDTAGDAEGAGDADAEEQETGAEAEAEPEAEGEPEAEANAEAGAEAEGDAEAEAGAEAEAEAEAEGDPYAEPHADADGEAEAEEEEQEQEPGSGAGEEGEAEGDGGEGEADGEPEAEEGSGGEAAAEGEEAGEPDADAEQEPGSAAGEQSEAEAEADTAAEDEAEGEASGEGASAGGEAEEQQEAGSGEAAEAEADADTADRDATSAFRSAYDPAYATDDADAPTARDAAGEDSPDGADAAGADGSDTAGADDDGSKPSARVPDPDAEPPRLPVENERPGSAGASPQNGSPPASPSRRDHQQLDGNDSLKRREGGGAQQSPPVFLCCKWPEGADWAVALASELEELGLTALHDARHRSKPAEVEEAVRSASCCVMLVTPGLYHGLANKPNGNRALKEVKWALQYGKPLVAVVGGPYAGQNPLPALPGDLAEGPEGVLPWSEEEMEALAGAQAIHVFKGGDGFDGYQRELVRVARAIAAEQAGAEPGAVLDPEAEERRMRELLRAAGLGKRASSLVDSHPPIRSLRALDAALRKGRLSAKPFGWSEAACRRTEQVLASWPVLVSMPDWLRVAPAPLVPALANLLGQEEAREFDREGRPRPRRGAVPPCTALELAGQGPVVVGPRGGAAVAAMLREAGKARAADAERQRKWREEKSGEASSSASPPPPPQPSTGTTLLNLTLVDLTDCALGTSAAGEVMSALAAFPAIHTLLLGGNGIGDGIASDFSVLMRKADMQASAARARSSEDGDGGPPALGLRTLGLERNQLTDEGAGLVVSVLADYPGSLTSLDLSYNVGLGSATAAALDRTLNARTSSKPRLARVGLFGCQMDDGALATFLPVLLAPHAPASAPPADDDDPSSPPRPVANTGVEELELAGNGIDSQALTALASAVQMAGYGGGPRAMNLGGANLKGQPRSHRITSTSGAQPGSNGGPAPSTPRGGNAGALAGVLLASHNLEQLGLSWCGLQGPGLRVLVTRLMAAAAAGQTGPDPQPLARLTVLDLTGNKLGPEGVSLLGALLPVNLPALRHLVLDECGLGGRDLGLLAGTLNVAPWVVDAVMGALASVVSLTETAGTRGVWHDHAEEAAARQKQAEAEKEAEGGEVAAAAPPPPPPPPPTSRGGAYGQHAQQQAAAPPLPPQKDSPGAAVAALTGLFRTWLMMEPHVAASELRRLMLPPPPLGQTPVQPNGTPPKSPRPASFRNGRRMAWGEQQGANGSGPQAPPAPPPSPITGLGCLLVHPVVQPVLEGLRRVWDALAAEAEAREAGSVPEGPGADDSSTPGPTPLSSHEGLAAFDALNNACIHMRGCGAVPGLQSLSMGRNALCLEAGASLGAALSLASGVRHLGLAGITQPPAAAAAGGGIAAVAAAAAAAQGGPLGAAAAAARDARALLKALYPESTAAAEAAVAAATAPPPPQPGAQQHRHLGFRGMGSSRAGSRPATSTGAYNNRRESAVGESSSPDPHAAVQASKQPQAASAAAAAGAAMMPGVRSLDLTDAGINELNAGHLAEIIRLIPALEQLTLDFNNLSGQSSSSSDGPSPPPPANGTAALFATLASLPSLAMLSLNFALDGPAVECLADEVLGLAALAAAVAAGPGAPPPPLACPGLRVLSLSGCPVDAVAARRLARALVHNNDLQVLRMGGGDPPEGCGPIGSRALGEALAGHKGLVELTLSGVGLTDNAASMFANAMASMPLLCKLDLSDNSLTSWGFGMKPTAARGRPTEADQKGAATP